MCLPDAEEGISIVAPACEEAENLPDLVQSVREAFAGHCRWELIVVDDGSRDDTPSVLSELQRETTRLRVTRHTERCGQSAGICTGVDIASYPWLGFIDADGQNDPVDLERLYREMLDAGDNAPGMLMGHRRRRADSWIRKVSSRVSNSIRAAVLRDATPDSRISGTRGR